MESGEGHGPGKKVSSEKAYIALRIQVALRCLDITYCDHIRPMDITYISQARLAARKLARLNDA